jgi:hypothetical protein
MDVRVWELDECLGCWVRLGWVGKEVRQVRKIKKRRDLIVLDRTAHSRGWISFSGGVLVKTPCYKK